MSYKYSYDHIPKTTSHNRRPGIKMEPTSITIHNTGNPSSTAKNERAWLTNTSNTRTESYHIVIDETDAIEVIPLNEVAWHAGDGSKEGSGNRTSIGIQICESGHYEQTLTNAVDLVAKMLFERNWTIRHLKRHFDWSQKYCPRLMNEDGKWTGWLQFLTRVQLKLNEFNTTVKPTPPPTTTTPVEPSCPSSSSNPSTIYLLSEIDANKIIHFLSAAWNATTNAEARKEFNRLANELRKASGQITI